MADLLVGSEDCPLRIVLNAFRFCLESGTLFTMWADLARALDIPHQTILKLKQDLLLDKKNVSDILNDLIVEWRQRHGRRATVASLVQIVENLALNDVADRLKEDFAAYFKPKPKPRKTFLQGSSGYLDLLERDNIDAVIVLTNDAPASLRKLQESSGNLKVIEQEALLDPLANLEKDEIKIYVVVCNQDFQFVIVIVQEMKKKACIITTVSQENDEVRKIKSGNKYIAEVVTDNTTWTNFSAKGQFQIKRTLEKLYGGEVATECMDSLSVTGLTKNDNATEEFLLDLAQGKEPSPFLNLIPEPLPYYISRQLLTRNVLSSKIFQSKSTDIFLFKGVDSMQLLNFTCGKPIDTSGSQIRQRSITPSSRFLLLEHSTHFEKIRRLLKSKHSMHLISQRDGNWIWEKTSGKITALQDLIDRSQKTISEDDFLNMMFEKSSTSDTTNTIVVADTAGMGKTVLLGQIARSLKKKFPERLVIFVGIAKFMSRVHYDEFPGISEMSEKIVIILADLVCKCSLSRIIFQALITSPDSTIKIELLFDGFDEVKAESVKLAHEMIRMIQTSFKTIRLWTTTRPQFLSSVEKELNVLGYNIQPFSKIDQVTFLSKYWLSQAALNQKKVNQFAISCIKFVSEHVNSEVEDIAGIPLQCMLIGEVYKEDAVLYCEPDESDDCDDDIGFVAETYSLIDLYKRFVDQKLEIFQKKYRHSNAPIAKEELLGVHMYLAVKLIFGKAEISEFSTTKNTTSLEPILQAGILQSQSSIESPQFIHRTFAEYFVALYIIKLVSTGSTMSSVWKQVSRYISVKKKTVEVFSEEDYDTDDSSESDDSEFDDSDFDYDDVEDNPSDSSDSSDDTTEIQGVSINLSDVSIQNASKFKNGIIWSFANSMLQTCKLDTLAKRAFMSHLSPMELTISMKACVYHNFRHLFQLFSTSVDSQEIQMAVFDMFSLFLCAHHCDIQFVKVFVSKFKILHRIDSLRNVTIEDESGNQIHYYLTDMAARSGNWAVFQYLWHEEEFFKDYTGTSIDRKHIFELCVMFSRGNTKEVIDHKILILNVLIEHNKELLWRPEFMDDDAVKLCYGMHPKLVLEYLKFCDKELARSFLKMSLYYAAFASYSAEETEILLEGLYSTKVVPLGEIKKVISTCIDSFRSGRIPSFAHALVLRNNLSMRNMELLEIFSANTHPGNHIFGSILCISISKKQDLNLIRHLSETSFEFGHELTLCDQEGNSLLHKYFLQGCQMRQGVTLLIETIGLDPYLTNADKKTPIYNFVKSYRERHWTEPLDILLYILKNIIKGDTAKLQDLLSLAQVLGKLRIIERISSWHKQSAAQGKHFSREYSNCIFAAQRARANQPESGNSTTLESGMGNEEGPSQNLGILQTGHLLD